MISKRSIWRWVASSCVVVVSLLFGAPLRAQTADLAEMPKPAAVVAWAKGTDALDTAARRAGAFHILREIIKDLAGPRTFSGAWTARETELLLSYQTAQSAAAAEGLAILKSQGAPPQGFNAAGPSWTRLKMKYETSAALENEVLETFFSATFRESYLDQKKSQNSRVAQSSQGASSGSPERGDVFDRLKRAVPDTAYAPTEIWLNLPQNPSLLLASWLLLLLYPLLGWKNSRRVKFSVTTGTVLGSQVSESTHTHTTAGTRDAAGVYTPGTTTTSKSRSEAFAMQNDHGRYTVVVDEVIFHAGASQVMSAVYSNNGALCHLHNHSSRRWQDLQRGYSRARVSSFASASLLTMLLCLVVALLLFVTGHWSETSAIPLGASFITFGFGFWFCGGFLMRFYHLVGDRRLRAVARGLPLQAKTL